MASEPKPPAAAPPKAEKPSASGDGRTMELAKKGGIVVGLISGILGLFFLLFPQYRPVVDDPAKEQSAKVSGLELNPQTTKGQYLDYSDKSKLGFTREQLAVLGAAAFANVQLVGYKGKTLTFERELVDARSGDVIGQARDFKVTPKVDDVTHRWSDWTPLRRGRGSYIMVLKVFDEDQAAAITCGQTSTFGGAAGTLPGRELHLCEGS